MSEPKPQNRGEVRIKPLLNGGEREFVASRRNIVFQTLKKLQIPCSRDKVPNIALLGSGGGQRAMVGLLESLVQLDKAGLLDCILYLSGVSGSTWCMASLYKEPNWSTKLETVKDKIIERINGPEVSWGDAFAKLKKYYYEKDFFNLTDVWAVMFITKNVKEIDEQTLTEQRNKHNKDPFPIYAVIDKKCKQCNDADPWFEINPYEAGYSLTGAFVDTCDFGSQFHKGSKKKHQDQFDMLYLQALCGSAIADEQDMWQRIKEFFQKKETILAAMREEHPERGLEEMKTVLEAGDKHKAAEEVLHSFSEYRQPDFNHCGFARDDHPVSPTVDDCYKELMDLVDKNLTVLHGIDTYGVDEPSMMKFKEHPERGLEEMKTVLEAGDDMMKFKDISEGKRAFSMKIMKNRNCWEKRRKSDIKSYTMDVCNNLGDRVNFWPFNVWASICKCMAQWIWGRKYNFLHNVTDGAVPAALLQNETRDYEDAGLLNNSPYFSVLRKDREIDLIISLDFSEGDPFMTVEEAAKTCRKLNIPFPEINIPIEDKNKPKDFYVFKGQNKTPTVIHIPLFNVVNCGDEIETWRENYRTVEAPYSPEMINDLVKVAGKNISNNREKLLKEIRAAVEKKRFRRFEMVTRRGFNIRPEESLTVLPRQPIYHVELH